MSRGVTRRRLNNIQKVVNSPLADMAVQLLQKTWHECTKSYFLWPLQFFYAAVPMFQFCDDKVPGIIAVSRWLPTARRRINFFRRAASPWT